MGTINKNSMFLFARPSFISGIARIIDFGGSLRGYNESDTPEQADELAIKNDWRVVGEDMSGALKMYERREKSKIAT